MSNGQSGGSYCKYPDDYYYDQLGPKVRKALQESVTTWSSRWALKMVKTYGAAYVIEALGDADIDFMKKGFRVKHFKKNHPSSFVAVNVKPLKANW